LEKDTTAGQIVAVANTGSNAMTLVSATHFTGTNLPVGRPFATPASIAARDSFLLTPLGGGDSVAVTHLFAAGGGVIQFVTLPAGAQASAIAIQDDSLAWVAEPGLDRVQQINYLTFDTTARTAAGAGASAAVVADGRVWAVNANGSSITVRLTSGASNAIDTIPLSGSNARFAVLGADGLIYVVDRGAQGQADGRLSIIDTATRSEVAVLNGLGELPGPVVYHPSGRLLIAAGANGILEINTLTRSLTRGPAAGLLPGGDSIVALAVDQRGRVYAVAPRGCSGPGTVHVLSAPPAYTELKAVAVGTCPRAAAVAFSPAIP
jgi:streptogramin lyase